MCLSYYVGIEQYAVSEKVIISLRFVTAKVTDITLSLQFTASFESLALIVSTSY
jgi:hypothetical protein